MVTHHIIITGKVQGVFFRATAKKVAKALQLLGWVKNTAKGEVEIMVSGAEPQLEEFAEWCKSGPPQAEVKNIKVEKVRNQDFNDFQILR